MDRRVVSRGIVGLRVRRPPPGCLSCRPPLQSAPDRDTISAAQQPEERSGPEAIVEEAMRKAGALIEALPYIQRFRGKWVVVKFGGSAMEDESVTNDVLEDVVFLATVGIRPIIVHGGGKRISRAMEMAGLEPTFIHGHRLTDRATLEIVVRVLTEEVSPAIVRRIAAHGGCGAPGFRDGKSLLRARKKSMTVTADDGRTEEVDVRFVGEVTSVDVPRLSALAGAEKILVVPPIGQDEAGQLYNVNADSAAAAVARELKAEKIVFLSDVHGIMTRPGDPGSFLSSVDKSEVDELVARGVIGGGMLPKVAACLQAISAGVRKAHIIDGRLAHSLLLEIFTDAGVGTEIVDTAAPGR